MTLKFGKSFTRSAMSAVMLTFALGTATQVTTSAAAINESTKVEDYLSPLSAESVHSKTNREIVLNLLKGHYSSPTIDDNLSSRMFDSY